MPETKVEFRPFAPYGSEKAEFLMAPNHMSISLARDAFLSLIYSYRLKTYGMAPGGQRRRRLVIDLRDVRRLGIDAALVLTAEYHRHLLFNPQFRPTIDDRDWPLRVRTLLRQLGFYSLVRAWRTTAIDPTPEESTLRFVRFHTGTLVEQAQAKELIESLKQAAGQEPEREYIYAALVEAIKNVKQHAYSSEDPTDLPSVGHWWVGGAYDPGSRVLQVVAYDQGVGIPATLERRSWIDSIRKGSRLELNDADLIAGAIEYSRSRMQGLADGADREAVDEAEGRGNGLWAICHFIKELDGSSVRIVSGRGEVIVSGEHRMVRQDYANPFCGTLIQWNLRMPAPPSGNADQGAER